MSIVGDKPVAIEVPFGHAIQLPRPGLLEGDIVVFHDPGISLVRLLPKHEEQPFARALEAHGLLPCVTCVPRQCARCPVAPYAGMGGFRRGGGP